MAAKYILEQRVIGPHLQMEIGEQRYNELAHARSVLSDALAFEQRYELLLGNFISMELKFSESCLRAMVEPQYRYPDIAEALRQANRHVVNVLTAMRGYVDQVPQDFKQVTLKPSFRKIAKDEFAKLFDRCSDYRFMCELRNHAQHKATAIQSFEGTNGNSSDPNGWVEKIKFCSNKTSLRADSGFKQKVLDEQPEKIDIRRCVRRSVQEMGETHLVLRKAISEHVDHARSMFEIAIRDYIEGGAESAIGLCARRENDTESEVPVLLDWDDVRLQLVEKNCRPPRLWPRQTHGEPKPEQIVTLREKVQHTPAEAAAMVFVSEGRWRDYELGLPMPEGLFYLYQLQVNQHPTHRLQPSSSEEGQS